MIVLSRATNPSSERQVVVILGTGLVGSAIVRSLKLLQFNVREQIKISWDVREDFVNCLSRAMESLRGDLSAIKIDWIWSAGKSQFSSDQPELDEEFYFFREYLFFIENWISKNNVSNHCIHMVSSAGGLFEGEHVLSTSHQPVPKRPYGKLKLAQENLLTSIFTHYKIYRPSSIYGYFKAGKRTGLISTLVSNAIRNKVTTIYGRPDTIRDYIWVEDIGQFLASSIISVQDAKVFFLVSSKPSNIYEIINVVQDLTNNKVLVAFDLKFSNQQNIIFSHSIDARPANVTDLLTGAAKIYQNCLNAGI